MQNYSQKNSAQVYEHNDLTPSSISAGQAGSKSPHDWLVRLVMNSTTLCDM